LKRCGVEFDAGTSQTKEMGMVQKDRIIEPVRSGTGGPGHTPARNNLSKLGTDLYEWNDLEIKVEGKKATILLNGKEAYSENYQEDLGNIVGLSYVFEGTGSIDFVELTDEKGKVVFQDDFEVYE